MHSHVVAAILLYPGQKPRPVLCHRLKGMNVAGIAHTPAREQGKKADIGANIPKAHSRPQDAHDRVLEGRFMRAAPVKLLMLRVNQQMQSSYGPRADHYPCEPRGHETVDERAQEARPERVT